MDFGVGERAPQHAEILIARLQSCVVLTFDIIRDRFGGKVYIL